MTEKFLLEVKFNSGEQMFVDLREVSRIYYSGELYAEKFFTLNFRDGKNSLKLAQEDNPESFELVKEWVEKNKLAKPGKVHGF